MIFVKKDLILILLVIYLIDYSIIFHYKMFKYLLFFIKIINNKYKIDL